MSFYKAGLAVGETPVRIVGETPVRIVGDEPKSGGMRGMIGSLIAIGAIGGALWWFLREKPKPVKQEGPDTSDIEERIRARGLDPHQFGYGRG
jgi:hypothetical protein